MDNISGGGGDYVQTPSPWGVNKVLIKNNYPEEVEKNCLLIIRM